MSTSRDAAVRSTAADDRSFFGHPRGLSTLFFTEMWERFSFYGIRPLLVLFMSAAIIDGGFGIERTQASAIVGIYAASVYLASLPGGWVADRLLGLRRAILLGAFLISLGHISIGLSSFAHSKVPFFLGLIFIVLGTGLLKPNISAIVGPVYEDCGFCRIEVVIPSPRELTRSVRTNTWQGGKRSLHFRRIKKRRGLTRCGVNFLQPRHVAS